MDHETAASVRAEAERCDGVWRLLLVDRRHIEAKYPAVFWRGRGDDDGEQKVARDETAPVDGQRVPGRGAGRL